MLHNITGVGILLLWQWPPAGYGQQQSMRR